MKKAYALGVALLVLLGTALASQAKGFNDLSFNGSYNTRHPSYVAVWEPFLKAAQEKFPGKNGLSFNYFGMNDLYPESEAFDAPTDGRVDVGTFNPAKYPGKMTLIKVVEIPGVTPNAIVGSLVTEDILEEFPEVRAQLPANSTPLTSWTSPTFSIHTIKPVKNLAELKGQKLIVWNAQSKNLAEALGIVPVRLNPPDTYLALSKGMADGVVTAVAPMKSYKIAELTPYHLNLNTGQGTFIVVANDSVWNDMPEDMQAWLKQEMGAKTALALGKSLDEAQVSDTKQMLNSGHEFYDLSDEDQAELQKALSPFVEHWKSEAAKDADPALVEKILQFALERSKYHQEQQKAGAYDKPVTFTAQ